MNGNPGFKIPFQDPVEALFKIVLQLALRITKFFKFSVSLQAIKQYHFC
ncbi:hypothetical protein N836_20950 [Leptolyngbya sp. Heron Island J]|nr:hypothetical protein N836_20950 [Leptolyngbya sp. Heron Island J]